MSAAVISIRGLSHSYGKGRLARQVLHDVNVDFYAGEIAIIMGPSGGGKTTLLSLAGGLRSVQSGSVRVAGLELRNANRKTLLAVRRKIGFVFQAHNLIDSLSICENVQIALSVDAAATPAGSKQMAVQLLTKVGLAEHADKRPRELSGGQNQRVAIARALVRAPQIIMADEPTAALDGASGREVVKLLGSLAREVRCTVLLVTHDTRILDIADHILSLEDGFIEETNLALDRLVDEVAALIELLARYPQRFAPGSGLQDLTSEFGSRLDNVGRHLAEMAARRLPAALGSRSQRWSSIADELRHLEQSMRDLASILAGGPHPADELSDAVAQGADFLMCTAAATFRSKSDQDAQLLASLTANHAQAHQSIRSQFETASGDGADRQGRTDLISVYFRCIYFLDHIARRWLEDLETRPARSILPPA